MSCAPSSVTSMRIGRRIRLSIAIETGFSVFPTMAAFESGKAIDRALDSGAALQPGVLTPLPAEAGRFESVATPRRSPPPPPVVARTRPNPAAAAATQARGGRAGYIPYVLGGVGVLLILFILFLFVLPSATVQIVIPARAISAAPTITGSTTPPGSGDTASVQTTLQSASEQMQQQNIPATGQKVIPAVAATGTVVFGNAFPPNVTVRFPTGTEVSTDDGKKYVTTADSTNVAGGGQSDPVPIQARVGGVAGNTKAGTIKNITNNKAPGFFTVTNPADVAGGVDASTKTVVAQTDQDKVKKALGDQLTTKVNADLQKSAGNQKLIAETLTVTVDASFDKKAGDEAANFNATVTVKGTEYSLDDGKVKQALTEALRRQAPGGYTLTDNPLKLDYKVVQHDDHGGLTLSGTASGFMATAINKEDIRSHVAGKSIAKARAYIHGNIDSSNIIISETPSLVPWLPFIGSRIDIKTTVENPQPG